MSVVFGSIAAGLLVLVVARLTGRLDAAVCAGIGLALGRTFWSQSIVAEVYALATALLVATLLFAVRWTDTRRTRDLMLAVGMAAIAVGNHLTIVMVAPGLIVMVLATDWRFALTPRRIAAMAALCLLGLSQYLLIVVLTHAHAPYLESSATDLRALIPVVAGAQFQSAGWDTSAGASC